MIEQRSPEWYAARLGKVTASRIADVVARTKSGWSASRANYMAELVTERLTGNPAPNFVSAAMQWGIDTEAEARLYYEFMQNVSVEQVGFVPHPTIGEAGASPDGLVAVDGLCEIKCPLTASHVQTLLTGAVAANYVTQMQWQLACTGRAFCDFVSYDPRLPESMRLFIQRVERDDKRIADLEADVIDFLAELHLTVHRLRAKYEPETVKPGALVELLGAC